MVVFQDSWLKKTDKYGTLVSLYAKKIPNKPNFCLCTVCGRQFSIVKGFEKIDQHAGTAKHKNNMSSNKSQMTLTEQNSFVSTSLSNVSLTKVSMPSDVIPAQGTSNMTGAVGKPKTTMLQLCNPKEDALSAEIYHCIDLVCCKYSENSSKHKKELYVKMFPGSISESMTLSPAKVSYLISDGIGPYFRNILLTDLNYDYLTASLEYDETTNNENKNELQIRIIFWSERDDMVVNRHLVTKFIEKADGKSLFEHLSNAVLSNGLTLKQILFLGKDGPKVNYKTERLFDEEKKKVHEGKGLLKLGSCNIHIVHNAMSKGLDTLAIDVSDFIIKIHLFFERSNLRWINYTNSQKEKKVKQIKLVKHLHVRWLSIEKASETTAEQLPALEHYFLEYIPSNEKVTLNNKLYKDIVEYLKEPLLKGYLLFVSFIAKIFTKHFTLTMQKAQPMIHLVYTQLSKLLMILLSSILKREVKNEKENFVLSSTLFEDNKIDKVLSDSSKLLPVLDVECGSDVAEFLKLFPEKDCVAFKFDLQKFYKAAALHINSKVVNRRMLRYFQCITPEKIKHSNSLRHIVAIAKELPLSGINYNDLLSEWRLLQLDDDICFELGEEERIDTYWAKIFKLKEANEPRYPNITRVVKAIVSIPQGNAESERGFSESAWHLTEDRTKMSERKLNARLTIIDAMKRYDNRADLLPMTKQLLNCGKNAYRSYYNYLEEEKKIKEENERLKKLSDEEKERELLTLKQLNQEMISIESLKKDLENAKKNYIECMKNSESMDEIIRQSAKNKCSSKIIVQLTNSLKKLKIKEKKARDLLDLLQDSIIKKNQDALKRVIKEKSNTKTNMF